jgi:predicted RNA-binding protein
MCLASLYTSATEEQPVLKDVASIRIADGAVEVETLFGEKKRLQGQIEQIDFVRSRVQLQRGSRSA